MYKVVVGGGVGLGGEEGRRGGKESEFLMFSP